MPPIFAEKPVLYYSTVQPAANPVQPGPNRTTRRRAAAEVANNEGLPRTDTAVPFPAQPADAPAPVQPSPAPLPRDPPINVMLDATPQRRQHQEDPVDEGGPIEGKSC